MAAETVRAQIAGRLANRLTMLDTRLREPPAIGPAPAVPDAGSSEVAARQAAAHLHPLG